MFDCAPTQMLRWPYDNIDFRYVMNYLALFNVNVVQSCLYSNAIPYVMMGGTMTFFCFEE